MATETISDTKIFYIKNVRKIGQLLYQKLLKYENFKIRKTIRINILLYKYLSYIKILYHIRINHAILRYTINFIKLIRVYMVLGGLVGTQRERAEHEMFENHFERRASSTKRLHNARAKTCAEIRRLLFETLL